MRCRRGRWPGLDGARIGLVRRWGYLHAGHPPPPWPRRETWTMFVVAVSPSNPVQFRPQRGLGNTRATRRAISINGDGQGVRRSFSRPGQPCTRRQQRVRYGGAALRRLCGRGVPDIRGVCHGGGKLFNRRSRMWRCSARKTISRPRSSGVWCAISLPHRDRGGADRAASPDGLAMSSRNVYLSATTAARAGLSRALQAAPACVQPGGAPAADVRAAHGEVKSRRMRCNLTTRDRGR